MIAVGALVLVGAAKVLIWLANRFPWLHLDEAGVALLWLFVALFVAAGLIATYVTVSHEGKKLLSAYVPPDIKP